MSIANYDILSILGNDISSSTYKVKHKKTGKILICRTVNYENKSGPEKEYLLDNIRKRSNICHPNIMKFYNYIDQKENKVLYILTEFCKNGSLKDMVDLCVSKNTCLSEELVYKILYQIAFAMKTINSYTEKLTTKEIFLDEEFNVKLFNFKPDCRKENLEVKMSYLGIVLYEIYTLKTFNESTYEKELIEMEKLFSCDLLTFIVRLIKDKTILQKSIDKILCHPHVLLKSAQWCKEKSFVSVEKYTKPEQLKQMTNQEETVTYTLKLDKLRKKEFHLQVREQELNEREYKLTIKEKKIALMERAIKEKLQQAELYLKRCRESKSVSSDSTKSIMSLQKPKKSYENLDSTYVSCGDSILLPTSKKLNVNKIIKPAPFTRTLSERRIRFKGHSPLKEIDFNKRSTKQTKSQNGILFKKKSEWLTCSDDTDKSSVGGNSENSRNKVKQLFSARNKYENDNLSNGDMQCKPIAWTEENKKYAFELLRMMNSDKENQCLEVKHTCL